MYDYNFTASTLGSNEHVPSFVWLMSGILLFLSHTLDGIDGKQARRTGTSSPVGEMFDHGCDGWAMILTTSTFYSVFGRNEEKVNNFADKFNIKPYAKFEDFISSKEIDAVYIATPHNSHYFFSLEAIKNKKHILMRSRIRILLVKTLGFRSEK